MIGQYPALQGIDFLQSRLAVATKLLGSPSGWRSLLQLWSCSRSLHPNQVNFLLHGDGKSRSGSLTSLRLYCWHLISFMYTFFRTVPFSKRPFHGVGVSGLILDSLSGPSIISSNTQLHVENLDRVEDVDDSKLRHPLVKGHELVHIFEQHLLHVSPPSCQSIGHL